MGLLTIIRNLIGIKKDRLESRKSELEIKKLEAEQKTRESIIQLPTPDEVKRYDPKLIKLNSEAITFWGVDTLYDPSHSPMNIDWNTYSDKRTLEYIIVGKEVPYSIKVLARLGLSKMALRQFHKRVRSLEKWRTSKG